MGKIKLNIIPELINRKVVSITCGDFHTLAVVEGYLPMTKQAKRTYLQKYYTGSDLFGWGENDEG